MKISSPGRYPSRATCHNPDKNVICQDKEHWSSPINVDILDEASGEDRSEELQAPRHRDIIVNYHIPFLGVIMVRAHSEEEADKTANIQISEGLSKIYLAKTKDIMSLEKLMVVAA